MKVATVAVIRRSAAAPKTRVGKIDYKALVTEHVAHHDIYQPVTRGGDRVAATLQAHGVRLLFTLCGGHISPILVGAKARGLRVVDVRDEATSVFAADGVARLTGAPDVAAVTAAPRPPFPPRRAAAHRRRPDRGRLGKWELLKMGRMRSEIEFNRDRSTS